MNRKGTLQIVETFQQHPLNGGGSFLVRCDCGNEFKCYFSRWVNYSGKGCKKCYKTNMFSGRNNPKYSHGGYLENKLEMNSYQGMMNRCYQKSYRAFHRYGGRGVYVCERWRGEGGFANFLSDMGKKPTPKHSIDRINNDGNYEPDNCRWATQTEQVRNSSKCL